MTIEPTLPRPGASLTPVQRLFSAAVGALIVACAPTVSGAPLSDITSSVQCAATAPGSPLQQTDPAACIVGGGGLSAFGEMRTSPFLSVVGDVSALGSPNHDMSASVHGSLRFEFQLLGGTAGDLVPILIATNLVTSGNDKDHSWGLATMHVEQVAGSPVTVSACTAGLGCGGTPNVFSVVMVMVESGGLVGGPSAAIDLTIDTFAGASSDDEFGFASANYAYVFVHPHFANAARYFLAFSNRITNASPDDADVDVPPLSVPEPASLALCLLGTALASRRARQARA